MTLDNTQNTRLVEKACQGTTVVLDYSASMNSSAMHTLLPLIKQAHPSLTCCLSRC